MPDLARPVRIDGKLYIATPAVITPVTALTCPANLTYRIRTVYACNVSAAAATFSLSILRTGVTYFMVRTVSVPINTQYGALTANDAIYLEPGDSLLHTSGTASALTVVISYEIVT